MSYLDKTYDEAVVDLRRGVIKVVFLTADGREREMWATRNNTLIVRTIEANPSDVTSDGAREKELKHNYVIVLDLQKGEFRRINLGTLMYWEVLSLDSRIPPLELNASAEKKKATFPKEAFAHIVPADF